MSKYPNDIDILYKNWCNMANGKNESVEDYTAQAMQFKNIYPVRRKKLNAQNSSENKDKGLGKSLLQSILRSMIFHKIR